MEEEVLEWPIPIIQLLIYEWAKNIFVPEKNLCHTQCIKQSVESDQTQRRFQLQFVIECVWDIISTP